MGSIAARRVIRAKWDADISGIAFLYLDFDVLGLALTFAVLGSCALADIISLLFGYFTVIYFGAREGCVGSAISCSTARLPKVIINWFMYFWVMVLGSLSPGDDSCYMGLWPHWRFGIGFC